MDLVQEHLENIDREKVYDRLNEMRKSIIRQQDQDCIAIIVEDGDFEILWDAMCLVRNGKVTV